MYIVVGFYRTIGGTLDLNDAYFYGKKSGSLVQSITVIFKWIIDKQQQKFAKFK